MAAVTALVAAAAIASAGASIYGGMQAQKAGKEQAALAISESNQRAAETKRLADRQVTLEERNIKDVTDRQKLAYLAGGVSLEGSPLLKLEETRRLGAENIDEIRKAGSAEELAQIAEGRSIATRAKDSGRNAFIGGIAGGASTLGTAYAGMR